MILATSSAPQTQKRHWRCLALRMHDWRVALSAHWLLFGACRQCAQGSLRRVFVSSIPTTPIHSWWCIGWGGGKTHKLQTLGVIKQGFVLFFIPLLTLSADVMRKFQSSNPTWGNVGVYHLDKLFECYPLVYHQLLHWCLSIEGCTSIILFIFLSPQFLMNHPAWVVVPRRHSCSLCQILQDYIRQSTTQFASTADCPHRDVSKILRSYPVKLTHCQFFHSGLHS